MLARATRQSKPTSSVPAHKSSAWSDPDNTEISRLFYGGQRTRLKATGARERYQLASGLTERVWFDLRQHRPPTPNVNKLTDHVVSRGGGEIQS